MAFYTWVAVLLLFESATAGVTAPSKVVSLSLASDEILIGLLGDSKQLDRLIGVSKYLDSGEYSNFLNYTNQKTIKKLRGVPRLGNRVEEVVRLKPDMVILASFNDPKYKRTLEKFKIPYMELKNFHTLDDIRENILTLAKLMNLGTSGARLVKKFDKKIGPKRHYPGVLIKLLQYSIYDSPPGPDSLSDAAMRHCGARNLVERSGWTKIKAESLARMKPDFVVLSKKDYSSIVKRYPWKNIPAIKSKRFIEVNGPDALSTSFYFANYIKSLCQQIKLSTEKMTNK